MMLRVALLATFAASLSTAVASVSMFRGDAARTGTYAGSDSPAKGSLKWSFKTGGPVVTSPAVTEESIFVGSDDAHLYALDRKTGELRWRFQTEGQVRSSPATDGNVVYFGSYDGWFYAVDAATGLLRWKFQTEGERKFEARGLHGLKPHFQTIPDFWDVYLSSPALHDGIVYFGCGDSYVYALDAQSGLLRWKFKTGDVVHSSPAISNGMLYIGSWDTYLYALDVANGQLRWKFKTGEDLERHNQTGIQSTPTVVDGTVYFGCRDAHLYALDAATGAERWRYSVKPTWINASPTVHKGIVYVGTSVPFLVHAVDAASGTMIRNRGADLIIFSSVAIAGEKAYVGTFGGTLYALSLSDLSETWTFQTEGRKANRAGIFKPDGTIDWSAVGFTSYFESIYVGGNNLFTLGSFLSSPVIFENVLFIGSTDGQVYAIE